jgi:hypothetical protein
MAVLGDAILSSVVAAKTTELCPHPDAKVLPRRRLKNIAVIPQFFKKKKFLNKPFLLQLSCFVFGYKIGHLFMQPFINLQC